MTILHPSSFILRRPRRRGQAMTEVVLLFPLFMVILFVIVKIFALLVLVQKLEIASFYAARRWQLESHLNSDYAPYDIPGLRDDIQDYVRKYIGDENTPTGKFLGITDITLKVEPTQVWNVVTLTVQTHQTRVELLCKYPVADVCNPFYPGDACLRGYDYLCEAGKPMVVTKYVPSRDRPIEFELPGLR